MHEGKFSKHAKQNIWCIEPINLEMVKGVRHHKIEIRVLIVFSLKAQELFGSQLIFHLWSTTFSMGKERK